MNFETFRQELLSFAPTKEALKKLGIKDESVERFISAFAIFPRTGELPVLDRSDFLGEFFSLYDPSSLVIGMVRFLPFSETKKFETIFGKVEADPLILDKQTGKIYVGDLTSPGHVLWECAESIEHFFLALIPAARYFGQCYMDESMEVNTILLNQTVNECILNAGGDKYTDFYCMLLGAD